MSEVVHCWSGEDLAGSGKRYQGQFIDGLVTFAIFAICLYITKLTGLNGEIADIVILVIPSLYFVLSDALPKGQSIGKKLLRISVVSKTTGRYCTVFQSFARNILTPILGVADAIFILFNNRQRLGDYMANTIVVNERQHHLNVRSDLS